MWGLSNQRVSRNFVVLPVSSFFSGLAGILAPVWVLYQTEYVGMSMTQVMFAQSTLSAVTVLVEVPSGALADRIGRQRTLLAGAIIAVVGASVLAFSTTAWHVTIAMACTGAAAAFTSGADSALIFDSLKELGRAGDFPRVSGRLHSIYFGTGFLVTMLGGWVLGAYGPAPVLAVYVLAHVLAALSVTLLVEPSQGDAASELASTGLRHTIRSAQFIWQHPILRFAVLFAMAGSVAGLLGYRLLNPYWQSRSVPVSYFGFAFAVYTGMSAVTSRCAGPVIAALGSARVLGLGLLAFCGTFVVLVNVQGLWPALVLPALYLAAGPLMHIALADVIHRHTESRQRATVVSMSSFAGQTSNMLLLPIFGIMTDEWNLEVALVSMSCVLSLGGTLALGALARWLRAEAPIVG